MKKCISALWALSLVFALSTPAFAGVVEYGAENAPSEKVYIQRFSDVPETHWAFKYVAELVERGAINGYPDGKFYPDKTVSREEFAKIMVVAAGLTAQPADQSSYTDVPLTYWASPFIETAKPYMTAYQNAQGLFFKPTDGALREDIAVAVVMLKGYDTRLADLSMIRTMFHDVDAISASAQPYVALAVENGIISGYVDGTFRGQNTITRSEAAAILWRAFQYGSDTKVIPGDTTTAVQPTTTPTPRPTASSAPQVSAPAGSEPSATPRPVETPKPFVAETLAKNISLSDPDMMMSMDGQDCLVYYSVGSKEILSLSSDGTGETLLDTAAATYTDEGGSAYKGLELQQIFWDDANGRLLVTGQMSPATEDGWSAGAGADKLDGIFSLSDGTLNKVFDLPSMFKLTSSYEPYKSIVCALPNGNYLCQAESYGTPDVLMCDLSDGAVVKNMWSGDTYHFVSGSAIFRAGNKGSQFTLEKYDNGANSWSSVLGSVTDIRYGSAAHCNDQKVYVWAQTELMAIRLTDGAYQRKVDLSQDVEALDMLPLPRSISRLFVTGDEQYVFYDDSAKAIRIIRPNPER